MMFSPLQQAGSSNSLKCCVFLFLFQNSMHTTLACRSWCGSAQSLVVVAFVLWSTSCAHTRYAGKDAITFIRIHKHKPFHPKTENVQRCVHLLLGPNYIRQSSEANEVNVLCPVTIAIATGARFRSVVAKTYPWRILFWSCRPHTRHRYNHQHGVTAAADADTADAYWLATVSRCSHTRIALVPCRFTRIRTRM